MPTPLDPRNVASVTRLPKGQTARRLYYFEERHLATAYNLHHAYAPVTRVPVAFEGVDSEAGPVASFASSLVALQGGGWRLYATADAGDPEGHDPEGRSIRAWDSGDGLSWRMVPIQPQAQGPERNRVAITGVPGDTRYMVQPQVVPLRDGRWRMYFWKHRDGHVRYAVAESADGLHWHVADFARPALYHAADGGLFAWAQGLAPQAGAAQGALSPEEIALRQRLTSNDATYVYFNDALDRYECYSVWLHPAIPDRRVDVDNAPGVHRLIHRRYSVDGLEWSDAELILMPDARDPWDLQFYFMAVQWHADWMIGSVGHYRVEDGQQTQDVTLCFSRDGARWERPVRGGLIPRPADGSGAVDSMGIYAPNAWLDRGDHWLILYTGTPNPHNRRGARTRVLGATLPKERFVGLAAGATPGGVLSDPFVYTGEAITLDADLRGWLRAELCDAFGRKLPGHHLMDAERVQGDSPAHALRWRKQPAEAHRYRCLRLRLEWADGVVYGIGF